MQPINNFIHIKQPTVYPLQKFMLTVITRAARKSQNHDHCEYHDLAIAVILRHMSVIIGRLCIKSAQWSSITPSWLSS